MKSIVPILSTVIPIPDIVRFGGYSLLKGNNLKSCCCTIEHSEYQGLPKVSRFTVPANTKSHRQTVLVLGQGDSYGNVSENNENCLHNRVSFLIRIPFFY
jgi:hypothetical protein